MLVFLVRGLFSNLKFLYAQFPCTALSGNQMYQPFWEAVGRHELCGFKVLALVCDGLAANRRLFNLHDPGSKCVVHKVSNPYAPGRDIFFLVDPPHLLKTVWNGWANSRRRLWVSHLAYKSFMIIIISLQCNGKEILWSHLVELYYNNRCQSKSERPGLALIKKLKFEHVNLTSLNRNYSLDPSSTFPILKQLIGQLDHVVLVNGTSVPYKQIPLLPWTSLKAWNCFSKIIMQVGISEPNLYTNIPQL